MIGLKKYNNNISSYDWSSPIISVYRLNGCSNSSQVFGYYWNNAPIVTNSLNN